MLVSVLTPVLNEGEALERVVPTMLAQRLPAAADGGECGEVEFIFAVGPSRDRTKEIVGSFAAVDSRVRIVDNPSGRIADGLNRALAQARGQFVARMDAHTLYPATYLAAGVQRLAAGGVAWVAGPAVARADGGFSGSIALALRSPLGRASRRFTSSVSPGGREQDLRTGVFLGVWRRSDLERYGGWNSNWVRNEDSELAARFLADGERIVSLDSMTAAYLPRRTFRAFLRQYHHNGRYRVRTLAHHSADRRPTYAVAPGLAAALPLAALGPRALRKPARVGTGAYLCAVAVETARAGRGRAPLRDVARLPLAFAAMHLGFGLGMWRGLAELAAARVRSSNPLSSRELRPRSSE